MSIRVYISGKITGLPYDEAVKKFNNSKDIINKAFRRPVIINPIEISPFDPKKEWQHYMKDCIIQLLTCNVIVLQKDWRQSKGARIEYAIAAELGLQIYLEEILASNLGYID